MTGEQHASDRDTVVFVSLSRGIGGPARALLSVLPHLGDEVARRVLFAPSGSLARLAARRGLVEEHVEMPWRARLRQLSRLRAAWALARLVRAERDRVLAVHANGQSELNLAVLAALVGRVPVVMWAHTSVPSPTAGLLRAYWRRRRDVRWLAVSDTARQVLATTLALEPGEVAVVHNPVDPAEVVGRPSARDGVAVGFLGLGTRAKGFDLLPGVVREVGPGTVSWQVFTNEPDARFLPDEHRAWRELDELTATHDVALRGRVRDVRRAYADCDVVLCPSHNEAFPMVAAEAMANGIPVVATDIPAYRDLVGDAGAGLLFPVDDAAAGAAAVRALAGDPQRRRSLGARGREAVRRYAPERIVPRLAEAYRTAGRRDA